MLAAAEGTLILTTPTTGFQGVKRQKDIPEEKEEEEAPDLPWLWSDRHSAETEHVGLGTSEEGSCRPSSRARAAQVCCFVFFVGYDLLAACDLSHRIKATLFYSGFRLMKGPLTAIGHSCRIAMPWGTVESRT